MKEHLSVNICTTFQVGILHTAAFTVLNIKIWHFLVIYVNFAIFTNFYFFFPVWTVQKASWGHFYLTWP